MMIKLSDFGMASIVKDGNKKFEGGGTVPFIVPEKEKREKQTTAADIWSLGILLWTLYWDMPNQTELQQRGVLYRMPKNPYLYTEYSKLHKLASAMILENEVVAQSDTGQFVVAFRGMFQLNPGIRATVNKCLECIANTQMRKRKSTDPCDKLKKKGKKGYEGGHGKY